MVQVELNRIRIDSSAPLLRMTGIKILGIFHHVFEYTLLLETRSTRRVTQPCKNERHNSQVVATYVGVEVLGRSLVELLEPVRIAIAMGPNPPG